MPSDAIRFDQVNKCFDSSLVSQVVGTIGKLKTGVGLGRELMPRRNILNNLSFCISKGERVGIIGPNGAGKSTILKMINGVTDPTSGTVVVNGSVGGIVEVGAGFQHELTAEENVKLNLTFQGYSLKEAEDAVEHVFEMADLTPYRRVMFGHLSSGQGIRLGFVAALIANSDIVLLDEVLAVGDAAFRVKSLEMCRSYLEGKTSIFISHNMAEITEICSRVLVVSQGSVVFDGNPAEAIRYHNNQQGVAVQHDQRVPPSNRHDVALVPKISVRSLALAEIPGDGTVTKGQVVCCNTLVDECESPLTLEIQLKKVQFGSLHTTISAASLSYAQGGLCRWEFETSALTPGDYLLVVQVLPGRLETPIPKSIGFKVGGSVDGRTKCLVDLSFRQLT